MKLSIFDVSKKVLLTAALTVSCLGIAAVGFAEAKAIEFDKVLRRSFMHTMRNEFYIRNANMYKSPFNGWGEISARQESGMDGSVTRTLLIGDLSDGPRGDILFHIKRQIVKKSDGRGQILFSKIEDVNYGLLIYPQDEESFKLVKPDRGRVPKTDVEGDYISTVEYPIMSVEAAMYVLERALKSQAKYQGMLEGAGIVNIGQFSDPVHTFRIVEQHPDHVVTRGEFRVNYMGEVLAYDVITDSWREITR